MWRATVWLLLALSSAYALTDEEMSAAEAFLQRYGYLPENYKTSDEKSKMMFEAVSNFQSMAGMNMTGVLGYEDLKMMDAPRCGMADMYRTTPKNTAWRSAELTYNIYSYPRNIQKAKVDQIIHRAFNIWSKYVNLRFIRSKNGNANFQVGFTPRQHGDGVNFDGPGKVLAHAFFPRNGRIHFDNEERWSESAGRELTNLYQVAAHEIGHALGLQHSDVRGALMAPYYTYDKKFINSLHRDDIAGIRTLYRPARLRKPQRLMENSVLCNEAPINSAMVYGKSMYVFKGDSVVKLNSDHSSANVKKISKVFKGLTNNVKAVKHQGQLYLFSNTQCWRYNEQIQLEDGYPKSISSEFPGIPANIDAVVNFKDKLLFFKGTQYWIYDSTKSPPVNPIYPKDITSMKGLPNKVDAAFYEENSSVMYIFRKNRVYLYNVVEEEVVEPTMSATKGFFGCAT